MFILLNCKVRVLYIKITTLWLESEKKYFQLMKVSLVLAWLICHTSSFSYSSIHLSSWSGLNPLVVALKWKG